MLLNIIKGNELVQHPQTTLLTDPMEIRTDTHYQTAGQLHLEKNNFAII